MFVPCFVVAQSKMAGIGSFKIGRTTISELEPIWQQDHQAMGHIDSDSPNVYYFFADDYIISGIPITNLRLIFYKDTLFSIECDYSDTLMKALKAKYGDPRVQIKKKAAVCPTGAETDESEFYPAAADMVAMGYFHMGFDKNCNKEFYNSFSLEKASTARSVDLADRKKGKEALKKKLDAF